MDRRTALGIIAAAPFALPGLARAAGYPSSAYDRAFVIDGQGVVTDPYGKPEDRRFSARAMADIRASGLTAYSATIGPVGNVADGWDGTVAGMGWVSRLIADNDDLALLVRSAADLKRAKAQRRVGVICNLQDTAAIGPELDGIAILNGLGIRVVQLTYNLRNRSGDGCLEPGNAGVSKLGRATIARIEQEKLLLDLSHAGQRTAAEGLAAATRPPTISHTGCRALHDNPRNQWDAELKACADKGGVVGIYWMPFLVASGTPSGADLVRHMAHAVNVCGEDHVSIGSDNILAKTVIDDKARAAQKKFFEDRSARGVAAPGEGPDIFNIVAEWDDHLRFRHLADGLAAAGWPARRIEKILGGNLLRLYGEVWGG